MSTIAQPRPARKPRQPRPADTCRLLIEVRGTAYVVSRPPFDRGAGVLAVLQLRKLDDSNEVYHIARHTQGYVSCTCPDYEFRHADKGTLCKHARAAIAQRLIPGPAVASDPWAEFEGETWSVTDLPEFVSEAIERAVEEGVLDAD